ncbi:pyruvate phosphate dikinase, partial [Kouleothrix aurantiaca]
NNLGEAMPNVMTPATWSLMQIFMADTMVFSAVQGHPLVGNIGGRAYMNVSLLATLAQAFGLGQQRFAEANKQVFGYVPAGLGVPTLPLGRWQIIREVLPQAVRMRRRVTANQPRLAAFLASAPERCTALRERATNARDAGELLALWENELMPFFRECSHMLEAGARRDGSVIVWVRRTLEQMVGEADTNALLAGLNGSGGQLASLGPLLGLTQLERGEIDRATFARTWGHRGPYEFEVSAPRPAEDPAWIDAQLAGLREAPLDVNGLLARQQTAQTAAWARLAARYPGKLARIRRKVAQAAEAYRMREAARSEVVRVFWPLRAFVQRAGALSGIGDDIFFLSIQEILALLRGERAALEHIPARRATFDHYVALPSYPAFIRGHFEPERWAADPARRSDVFDAAQTAAPTSATVSGFPGAAGVVEGRARVLDHAEDGG